MKQYSRRQWFNILHCINDRDLTPWSFWDRCYKVGLTPKEAVVWNIAQWPWP